MQDKWREGFIISATPTGRKEGEHKVTHYSYTGTQ